MEQYKIISLLISVSVFASYTGYIWIKYGVQTSISDSYYRLPKKWRWIFTFFCWGFSVPVAVIIFTPLMFAAVAGICMVGAAPNYLMKLEQKLTQEYYAHYGGAITGVLFLQLSIFFDFVWYDLNILSIIAMIVMALFAKNKIWWIEIVAYITLIILITNS